MENRTTLYVRKIKKVNYIIIVIIADLIFLMNCSIIKRYDDKCKLNTELIKTVICDDCFLQYLNRYKLDDVDMSENRCEVCVFRDTSLLCLNKDTTIKIDSLKINFWRKEQLFFRGVNYYIEIIEIFHIRKKSIIRFIVIDCTSKYTNLDCRYTVTKHIGSYMIEDRYIAIIVQ